MLKLYLISSPDLVGLNEEDEDDPRDDNADLVLENIFSPVEILRASKL